MLLPRCPQPVQDMLSPFPPALTLPLYSSGNLTCFVVYSTAAAVANATAALASTPRYVTPVPMVSKVRTTYPCCLVMLWRAGWESHTTWQLRVQCQL